MGRIGDWFERLLTGPEVPPDDFVNHLENADQLGDALHTDMALVYKHSPICHLSSMAFAELRRLYRDGFDVPLFMVDVLRNRSLSDLVERELGVRHESPQIFLLAAGKPVWHSSHWGIKAETIREAADREG